MPFRALKDFKLLFKGFNQDFKLYVFFITPWLRFCFLGSGRLLRRLPLFLFRLLLTLLPVLLPVLHCMMHGLGPRFLCPEMLLHLKGCPRTCLKHFTMYGPGPGLVCPEALLHLKGCPETFLKHVVGNLFAPPAGRF